MANTINWNPNLPPIPKERMSRWLEDRSTRAIEFHERSIQSAKSTLEYAYEVGRVLNDVKQATGGRKKWSEWRTRYFCEPTGLSKESANQYARIARHWNDPDIIKARESGGLDSIAAFERIRQGKPPLNPKNKPLGDRRAWMDKEDALQPKEIAKRIVNKMKRSWEDKIAGLPRHVLLHLDPLAEDESRLDKEYLARWDKEQMKRSRNNEPRVPKNALQYDLIGHDFLWSKVRDALVDTALEYQRHTDGEPPYDYDYDEEGRRQQMERIKRRANRGKHIDGK